MGDAQTRCFGYPRMRPGLPVRSFHRRGPWLLAALFVAILWHAPAAHAQVSASISGRVTDPTGATVSGATITAKNIETGQTRAVITDGTGHYWVPSLPVGEYELRATKDGFQELVRAGIHLVVGQEAGVDFTLKIGAISERFRVEAEVPVINVTSADISGLVGEQQVKDLPAQREKLRRIDDAQSRRGELHLG